LILVLSTNLDRIFLNLLMSFTQGKFYFILFVLAMTITKIMKKHAVEMYAKKLASGSGKKKRVATPKSIIMGKRLNFIITPIF